MGKVDILTIGNESFLESRREDHNSTLNAFYEKVAAHVIAHRKKHFGPHGRTRLYMGALNHLDNPKEIIPATERWMTFVRETPDIKGVDIHPHVVSLEAADKYLDYVLPRLHEDQKFLVTEFSLVLYWEKHMRDKVSAQFAERYDVDPVKQVWQVIAEAIRNPFTQKKWDDFLSMSPWFESRKGYLTNQVRKFRETGKLAVATYSVSQIESMVEGFDPDKKPWLLNPLYANRTVQQDENGMPGRNYAWFEEFRALQRS
ncbi:hypothetical protein [Streptomyces sp. NPDC050704]|uniref:hypothetical protein n=1 Tax=Streptomyces sp. NPDC050704 TaxID=3157219 RepID=UPI003416BE51